MADEVTAALEEIRERDVAGIRSHPWIDDVPRLLAAVEAVLKAHRPSTSDGKCCWCREADGQRSEWPCGEYLTITRELTRGATDEG